MYTTLVLCVCLRVRAAIRAGGGQAAAHPGGEGGPGRARPRQQGDRLWLRRPRLRRRPRAPLRCALSSMRATILAPRLLTMQYLFSYYVMSHLCITLSSCRCLPALVH